MCKDRIKIQLLIAVAAAMLLLPSPALAQKQLTQRDYLNQYLALMKFQMDADVYHRNTGQYPAATDTQTWYEVFVAHKHGLENPPTNYTPIVSSDGRHVLDIFGNPIIYEQPASKVPGHHICIRSVGPNGIDEGGKGDDWDIRFGPNPGYWYRSHWPTAERRAFHSVLWGLVGGIAIIAFVRIRSSRPHWWERWAGVYLAMICFGAVLGNLMLASKVHDVNPYFNFGMNPVWLDPLMYLGFAVWFAGMVFLVVMSVAQWRYKREQKRSERLGCCRGCEYDLRGTLAAGHTHCPECGQPISRDVISRPLHL